MVTVSKMMEPIPYDGPETWEDMTGKQGMIKYFTNRINHEIYEGKMFDRMLKNSGCTKAQRKMAEERRERCYWYATAYQRVLDDLHAGRLDKLLYKGIIPSE